MTRLDPRTAAAAVARPGLDDARAVLRRHFGYEQFRTGQADAVAAVLSGRDALVLMPTGGGKSLCYQIPSQLLPGPTLVVSPLISLMKDQVDALEGVGLPATSIDSTLPREEALARIERLRRGELKLLYVAPERFDSPAFRDRLARLDVSLLAVDEAHCISAWGHEFRPSYRRLGEVRAALGCPAIALTATATPDVRRDIVRQLGLRDPVVVTRSFDRPNLSWHVLDAAGDAEKCRLLLALLRGRTPEGVAIVYASTRRKVDALSDLLDQAGIPAAGYHAGASGDERRRLQDAFMAEEVGVVVATNAFGMGIDKPNVRLVAHYDAPASLEAYYQEAGRAGRDRAPATCVLLHAGRDWLTQRFLIEQGQPPRRVVEAVYRALRARADADGLVAFSGDELGRAVADAKGDRPLEASLRILEQAGVVRRIAGAARAPTIRLLATGARVRRELHGAARGAGRALLRGLWARAGAALYRGVEFGWDELSALTGSRDAARARLDALQAEGFLEWTARPGGDALHLLVDARPARLPIDWNALGLRRRCEEGKLRQMRRYVYHAGCRRRFLLRYFGDPDASGRRCTSCDNCLGSAGRILPGARSPRRHRFTSRK